MIALRVRRRPAAVSITSVALAAALAGCTVGPDYRRPDVDTPAAWRLDPADAYWHPAAPARAPLDPAWWTAFGDPQLDALEADALRNNQNLKAVAARYDQAKATLASVASAQYPAVGLNASGQRFKISADRPQTNYATKSTSTVQNEIQAARPSATNSTCSAACGAASNRRRRPPSRPATISRTRAVLTANLASSYFALREFDTEIDVVKRSIDLQQKALDYVSARHDLGAVSGLDLLQQRAQLDATRTQAQLLLQQRVQVETAIATLVGTPAPPSRSRRASCRSTRRRCRPACRATCCSGARRRVGRARDGRRECADRRRARRVFPAHHAVARYRLGRDALRRPVHRAGVAGSVGGSLSQPLLEGGKLKAGVDFAQAGYVAAQASYRQTVLTAFQEVQNAVTGLSVLADAAQQAAAAVDDARKLVSLAQDRYAGGLTPFIDVLTAQQQLLTSERQAVQIQGQRAALVVFREGAGRRLGWPPRAAAPAEVATAAPVPAPAPAHPALTGLPGQRIRT